MSWQSWLLRNIPAAPRAVPTSAALFPYVVDDASPDLRALRAATLAQMQSALGGGGGAGAAVDPADIIYRGAEGSVWNARQTADGLYLYNSDQRGAGPDAFRGRSDIVPSGQMLDTFDAIDVEIGYGQSWRVTRPTDTGGGRPITGADRWGVLQVVQPDGTFVQGWGDGTATAYDVRGREFAAGTGTELSDQIGHMAAQTRQAFRRLYRNPVRPIIHFSPARSAARWSQNPSNPSGPWLAPGSAPWASLTGIIGSLPAVAAKYGKTLRWRSLAWTHGANTASDLDYTAELTSMLAAFNALALNGAGGAPLRVYMDLSGNDISTTTLPDNFFKPLPWALANAGQVTMYGPRYPYPLEDTIHHTAYGQARIGELEGYVKWQTDDRGTPWVPLYITGASIAGAVITLTTSRPFFAGISDRVLSIDTTETPAVSNYGFQVRVGGTPLSIASVAVSGTTIIITLASTPSAGTQMEVSYAAYGTAMSAGTWVGCRGNVKMSGPASPWFAGKTVDTWLCYDKRTLTA